MNSFFMVSWQIAGMSANQCFPKQKDAEDFVKERRSHEFFGRFQHDVFYCEEIYFSGIYETKRCLTVI